MRRLPIAGLALLLALAATACGSGGSPGQGASTGPRAAIVVKGPEGSKPTIRVKAPLKLSKSSSWTLARGQGATVGKGDSYLVDLTFADGRTGKVVASTYDQGQQPVLFGPGQDFPVITKAVTGMPAGSRVVVAAAPQDAYGSKGNSQLGIKPGDSVVMVADVTSTVLPGPHGTSVKPPAGTPHLEVTNGVPSGFGFAGARKPGKLRVVTLVRGTGPALKPGDVVVANYLGAVWGKHQPFDASYTRGQPFSFTLGQGQVIPAWDKGLTGVTVGSRVLLLCPPGVAYGAQGSGSSIPPHATLAFVVDVLGSA
ncbi:MAG TPA: FKBP-type peptidyl-prolyl cis-trans isomerase [Marmoricola sp.]|nr:FKBP-type peptidyl-prolyl cis-trans isomerase [Marmoricola sp.]